MARCSSTACPITDLRPKSQTWSVFSMFEVCVEHTFAAGHSLRNYRGKCENIHGHNYRVEVSVEGDSLNETGLLVDFTELKRMLRQTSEYLDHQFINDLKP